MTSLDISRSKIKAIVTVECECGLEYLSTTWGNEKSVDGGPAPRGPAARKQSADIDRAYRATLHSMSRNDQRRCLSY
jgi:hypothetical protein